MSHFRAPGRHALLAARRASPALHQTRRRLYATRPPKSDGGGGFLRFVALFGGAAAAGYYFRDYFTKETDGSSQKAANAQIAPAELQFEERPKQLSTKEETRDSLSSQHLQVKQSWESPGVYAWGSNASLVVDPTASSDKPVKAPKRISYFDGQLLRDLKLAKNFGVAVTEKGDLVQWGTGYSKANPAPAVTLKGADVTKVGVSADRVIALSSNGRVFSIPASKDDLETGSKLVDDASKSSSWMSFWSSSPFSTSVSARDLTPPTLSRGEKIVDISSGVDHCLMLSSKGRVFSSAASTTDFPSKGQMGIPGLSWATRPQGAYDQPHEIATLSGFDITDIATGDYHSAALDRDGKVFTFGDNTFGQLGFTSEPGFQSIDVPSLLPIGKLYANSGLVPRITSVAAGGDNTFFTVDARAPERQEPGTILSGQQRPRVAADLWACGKGLAGSLGNGRWTHVTPGPTKVKALSSLFEFDERSGAMVPIRLAYLAVGGTHAGAVLANVTRSTAATAKAASSVADTNWGADVLFWGGNESWQLGSGKRTNVNAPMYIAPLEREGAAGEHRLQLTPRRTVRLGEGGTGRKATLEQRLVCGPNATAVYSKT